VAADLLLMVNLSHLITIGRVEVLLYVRRSVLR
jgi:hypothetical protein